MPLKYLLERYLRAPGPENKLDRYGLPTGSLTQASPPPAPPIVVAIAQSLASSGPVAFVNFGCIAIGILQLLAVSPIFVDLLPKYYYDLLNLVVLKGDSMAEMARIGGKYYHEIERLKQPFSDEIIIVCTDEDGIRYACPSSMWNEHSVPDTAPYFSDAKVGNHSVSSEKIKLFRSLFRGREDVYAKRYYNFKSGSGGYVQIGTD